MGPPTPPHHHHQYGQSPMNGQPQMMPPPHGGPMHLVTVAGNGPPPQGQQQQQGGHVVNSPHGLAMIGRAPAQQMNVPMSHNGNGNNGFVQVPQMGPGGPQGHHHHMHQHMGGAMGPTPRDVLSMNTQRVSFCVHILFKGACFYCGLLSFQNGKEMNMGSVGLLHHQQAGANGQSAVKVKYLLAAYRVGMLALETLGRKVHDDRPQAKFARNPTYGEDVKWLLSISRKLGAQYLQQFCICAVNSIANPFVLHEIVLDAALVSSRNNLAWVYQNPRSPLQPLVQKCQQMYFQCLHQKLYHISASDYEDFVSIVCTARKAFHLTPDGASQFKEWLQNLRR